MPVGDAREVMEAAVRAEAHGWDGLFVSEPVWGVDAWLSLTAAALATSSIRIGTLLSPLSRMRPWEVAARSATLDHLSGGRLVLSVGLGATDSGFESFGEVTDVRRRAELLDESLDIVTGLWRGQPFTYAGKHYRIDESDFPHTPPDPVHDARVPIWVVGLWPHRRSMARAVQHQGIIASVRNERGEPGHVRPADVRAIREFAGSGIDIIVEGEGEAPQSGSEWQDAGATWHIESLWQEQFADDVQARVHARLKAGPPRWM